MIVVSFTDLEHEVVPDPLSILGAIPGIAFWGLKGDPLFSLLGAFTGLSFMYILSRLASAIFKKEAFGEGDVKLAMTIGAYLGIQGLFLSLFFAVLLGAACGSILLALRIKHFGEHIPFAPAMATGAVIALFYGQAVLNWYFGM